MTPDPAPETAPRTMSAEDLARQFHETYERLSPQYGYATREDTRTFDSRSSNGRLMIAVCAEVVSPLRAALTEAKRMTETWYSRAMAHKEGARCTEVANAALRARVAALEDIGVRVLRDFDGWAKDVNTVLGRNMDQDASWPTLREFRAALARGTPERGNEMERESL